MVQAYNFLAAWQLFPEKCIYEYGIAPKSGNYKLETTGNGNLLSVSINWIAQDNQAFYTQYNMIPDGVNHAFDQTAIADTINCNIVNASNITTHFFKNEKQVLEVTNEILPNGFLRITQQGVDNEEKPYKNTEIYHKQLSVLPYASAVGSVVIRPTEEGVIKHKALQAMEEQTNMQLDQIRQQIELLAKQAQEIRKRRELSMMIYQAKINFQPVIGQIYHLYEKHDNSCILSLIAPEEWGHSMPFKNFISSVKLLADHTWVDVS